MKVSETHVIQDILLTCDMLEHEQSPVTVESVWQRLVKESGYEYPRGIITSTLADRHSYAWNTKTHGYERQ